MFGNFCVEFYLCELQEWGFEVVVVFDVMVFVKFLGMDVDMVVFINFMLLVEKVYIMDEFVNEMWQ